MTMTLDRYTDGPIGSVEIIPDFLPSPQELSFKEGRARVAFPSRTREKADFYRSKYQRTAQNALRSCVPH